MCVCAIVYLRRILWRRNAARLRPSVRINIILKIADKPIYFLSRNWPVLFDGPRFPAFVAENMGKNARRTNIIAVVQCEPTSLSMSMSRSSSLIFVGLYLFRCDVQTIYHFKWRNGVSANAGHSGFGYANRQRVDCTNLYRWQTKWTHRTSDKKMNVAKTTQMW